MPLAAENDALALCASAAVMNVNNYFMFFFSEIYVCVAFYVINTTTLSYFRLG